ncbi:MAG: response regulator [Chthoniobacteraceae bacterium]
MDQPTSSLKALIIDDSRTIRLMLDSLMKEFGFGTVHAADGIEALQQLEKHWPFDLALVDWEMPRMSGLEFVENTRENDGYNPMKIMMVTTINSFQQVARALKAGADEYHMKPVTRESLGAKLQLLDLLPVAEVEA